MALLLLGTMATELGAQVIVSQFLIWADRSGVEGDQSRLAVELYNCGSNPIDLQGFVLNLLHPSDPIEVLDPTPLSPGEVIVIGDFPGADIPLDLDPIGQMDQIPNPDYLTLQDPPGNIIDFLIYAHDPSLAIYPPGVTFLPIPYPIPRNTLRLNLERVQNTSSGQEFERFDWNTRNPTVRGFGVPPDQAIPCTADLEITKTSNTSSAMPGESLVYQVDLTNHGPHSDPSVEITDVFSTDLTCEFTSSSADVTGHGQGPLGVDGIHDMLSMPPGSSVEYVAQCTISEDAVGILENTATVASSVVDPETDNNTSTARIALGQGLVHYSALPASLPEPGGTTELSILIQNPLPGPLVLVSLDDDQLGDLVALGLCEADPAAPPGTIDEIAAGGAYTCDFQLLFEDQNPTIFVHTLTAMTQEGTQPPQNQASLPAQIAITDTVPSIVIEQSSNASVFEVGSLGEFTVTITNVGVSTDPVGLESLTYSIDGGDERELLPDACPAPASISPGETFECIYDAVMAGVIGETFQTITALVADDDGSTTTQSTSTTLELTGADYGDAPSLEDRSPYPTLFAQDGARHQILPGFSLGEGVDAEADGQPGACILPADDCALADDRDGGDSSIGDDEDGVVFADSFLVQGNPANITVVASLPGLLDAWIDFNADGDWQDDGEKIFDHQLLTAGANTLSFQVDPQAAVGMDGASAVTFARFRLTSTGIASPMGLASDGEVEDHAVEIRAPSADLLIVEGEIDSPDPVTVGQEVLYTLQVTNTGPQPATGVETLNLLPLQVSAVAWEPASHWLCELLTGDTLLLRCRYLTDLSVGATTEPLRILVPAPATPTNMVLNIGVQSSTFDPDLDGNALREVTTVLRSWTSADPLEVARRAHTATLLPSGQVLVAGGRADGTALNATELYDPTTGAWMTTGPLSAARSHHTATLLSSGEVLVVGGYDTQGQPLASIERYDPTTGQWTLTRDLPLAVARARHTTTLSRTGELLVVGGCTTALAEGGCTAAGALASSVLYDPRTPGWLAPCAGDLPESPVLAEARAGHTATLLPSGEILVVGGWDTDNQRLASSEIYHPAVCQWTTTPSMATARAGHTTTLLARDMGADEIHVLVMGGTGEAPQGERLTLGGTGEPLWSPITGPLVSGSGHHASTLLPSGQVLLIGQSAALYDDSTQQLVEAPDPTTPRSEHTATLLPSGEVLVVGGCAGDCTTAPAISSIDVFASTGLGFDVQPGLERRAEHTAVLLPSGRVLVMGGTGSATTLDPRDFTSTIESDGSGAKTPGGNLQTPRRRHSATLLPSGTVLLVGGLDSEGNAVAQAELFLEGSEGCIAGGEPTQWCLVGDNPTARYAHTATLLPSGTVLISGGFGSDHSPLTSAQLYDPTTETFTPLAPMLGARAEHSATLLPSGKVLIAGGRDVLGSLARTEIYDPATGQWAAAAFLTRARAGHTATLLPSGQVLVAGGDPATGSELYDPASNSWSPTAEQPKPRTGRQTATLLPSGKVLLLGEAEDQVSVAELYDPATDTWNLVSGSVTREAHTATLLPSGKVMVLGGFFSFGSDGGSQEIREVHSVAQLFDPGFATDRRPTLASFPNVLDYLDSSQGVLVGEGFRGDSETSGGSTTNSAADLPLVLLQPLEGGVPAWLGVEELLACTEPDGCAPDTETLRITDIPPVFNSGWHLLSVVASGVPSEARAVHFDCATLQITTHPLDRSAGVGESAIFDVVTRGGRFFQWQQCLGDDTECAPDGPGWVDIPGATGASYTTPLIAGPESGTRFRVVVDNGCLDAPETSQTALLSVLDEDPPGVQVTTPTGGEYWPLSTAQGQNIELVGFAVSDPTTWLCDLRVSLIYSDDDGVTWFEAPPNIDPPGNGPGELPRTLGGSQGCLFTEAVGSGTLTYQLPMEDFPPSGVQGSLYKIRLEATDHAENIALAESPHPFFIVPPNDESVRTLILAHPERLGVDCGPGVDPEPELCRKLRELADHPQVNGLLIDLGTDQDLAQLYAEWDAADQAAQASGDAMDRDEANRKANTLLFGSDGSNLIGLRDKLDDLLRIFGGVESVMLIGGDSVIPFARVPDRAGLLGEAAYTEEGQTDLPANGSSVSRAIDGGFYLSDDPLVTFLVPIDGEVDILQEGAIFLPDLAVGRLVETPEEIVTAIAQFQASNGELDLRDREHKVLVTGYDFLADSATIVDEKWRCSFDPQDDPTLCEPPPGTVDATLLGQGFSQGDLLDKLCGEGEPYGLINLNGHATHYLEGVPGETHFDIEGLETDTISAETACGGDPLDLDGAVIYAVGCHGGLPVPGTDPDDSDHSLDLPQVFLEHGALAYLANTGYGWGLQEGVGYSERLIEIFTDQLRIGDSTSVGRAVLDAKLRYYQEARGLDAYGIKTLMQWTTFGFPMAKIVTGLAPPDDTEANNLELLRPWRGPASAIEDLPTVEDLGPITVHRQFRGAGTASEGGGNPDFLTIESKTLFFSEASYVKRQADGSRVPTGIEGCPSEQGCYYTLNGLGERGTGDTDLPIQPFHLERGQVAGASQHGVLWLGGEYREEGDWRPIFAELVSNSEDTGDNHGSAPQDMVGDPIDTPWPSQASSEDCRFDDREINTRIVPVGEVRQGPGGSGAGPVDPASYTIQRRYLSVAYEVFYFNDLVQPNNNCDREGPSGLEPDAGPFDGQYHQSEGSTLSWQVSVDDPSGIWRVLVVYDARDTREAEDGEWVPLELSWDPAIMAWTGSESFANGQTVTYLIQAIDNRGNVSWLRFAQGEVPPGAPGMGPEGTTNATSSGVDPRHPDTVPVDIGARANLVLALAADPDPVDTEADLEVTLEISNANGDPATALELILDPFPGSSLLAAGDTQWSCGLDQGQIVCGRDQLAVGASSTLSILLRAPSQAGPTTASALVRSAEVDPYLPDNTAEVTVLVVDPDPPPQVIALGSAAAVPGGLMADGSREIVVPVAITQLRLGFDEAVIGADDSDTFLLLEAGDDGFWQTESILGGVAGDDLVVPFGEISYETATHTTVLGLPGALPLPPGRYRLLAGSGILDQALQLLDGDGDGEGGDDFRSEWRVDRRHRLINPNFDRSLADWLTVAGPSGEIAHSLLDADGVPSSGSARVTNFSDFPGSYALSQCLAVEPGERLAFGGRLRRDPAEPWTMLRLEAEVWPSTDCGGTPIAQAATEALEVEPGGDDGSWIALPLGLIDVPEDGYSLQLTLFATADDSESAELGLDAMELYPMLFGDGFETGDASRWSAVVGEGQ